LEWARRRERRAETKARRDKLAAICIRFRELVKSVLDDVDQPDAKALLVESDTLVGHFVEKHLSGTLDARTISEIEEKATDLNKRVEEYADQLGIERLPVRR
jgi:hypothetical protein